MLAEATHFNVLRKILRVLCGHFEHLRRVQFEGCVAEPPLTTTAMLPGSKWSCLCMCCSTGEGEWKEVRCKIFTYRGKSGLPVKFHEDWCKEVVEDWCGDGSGSPARASRGQEVGIAPIEGSN